MTGISELVLPKQLLHLLLLLGYIRRFLLWAFDAVGLGDLLDLEDDHHALLQDGVRRGCPLPFVRPLPPRRVVEPLPPGHCLRHADEPPFSQAARRCCAKNTCCKCMLLENLG